MMGGEFGFPRRWIAVASVAVDLHLVVIGMHLVPPAGAAEPEAAKPELAVAVKDVCAWPNLTPLADGSVVATIFNQPCHGLWEGDVECWATADGGQSWQLRGTPAPHDPTTNRMNVAAGRNAKGELVVLASGWSHRPPPPPEGTPATGHGPPSAVLPIWVCRSADGGRTWSPPERIAGFDGDGGYPATVELADGRLLTAFYAKRSALRDGYQMATVTWRLPSKP